MEQKKWQRDLPPYFNLYADSEYSETDQLNRKWILSNSRMYPPALTVQSDPKNNNGLINIFPSFLEENILVCDPSDYYSSPQIDDFFLNWIDHSFQPLINIQVTSTLWVPDPNIICGIFQLENQSKRDRSIQIDLGCITNSLKTGQRIGNKNYHGLDILTGQLGSWFPVLFLSGSTQFCAGPYPTLSSKLDLKIGSQKILHWVAILGSSLEDSMFDLDRVNKLDWSGELARIKIKAQDQLEIKTGNPQWDFALSMSQKEGAAYFAGNVIGSKEESIYPKVLTAFQGLYLLQVLSPIDPGKARKILDAVLQNKLSKENQPDQKQDQLKEYLPLPLLGELLWQITQDYGGEDQLEKELGLLEDSLLNWFSKDYDQDNDGIPEIIHPSQLNLADTHSEKSIAIFDLYDHLPFQESPGVAAIISNDLERLKELKAFFVSKNVNKSLKKKPGLLREYIKQSWDAEKAFFYNRDRDTHLVLDGNYLIQNTQENFVILRKELINPSRIGLFIQAYDLPEIKTGIIFTLHGKDQAGNYRIENISNPQIYWGSKVGWTFSQIIFSSLDYITVKGLGKDCSLTIFQPSTCRENISLMLPLWAVLLNKQDAESLITNTITNPDRFWSPFGIRSFADPNNAYIQLPWNMLVGQGLISYGYLNIAVEVIIRMMKAITMNLDRSGNFYSTIDASIGEGIGECNSLEGLIPIGFLLQVMGVKIVPDRKIIVEGEYPFSWPVTLKFRGIIIHRNQIETRINIPGEDTIYINNPEKKIIPLP